MQKNKIFFAFIVSGLIVLTGAIYWYQKPREDVTEIKPAYSVSAKELYDAFQQDEEKANKQFLEKIIQVKGIVNNVQETDSTINILLSTGNDLGGINCTIFKKSGGVVKPPEKGAITKVKGKCIGFLMDVNLVDAIIEQ